MFSGLYFNALGTSKKPYAPIDVFLESFVKVLILRTSVSFGLTLSVNAKSKVAPVPWPLPDDVTTVELIFPGCPTNSLYKP